MAGMLKVAQTGEIALVASEGERTILQVFVNVNDARAMIKEISVSFKGQSNSAPPALVKVKRQKNDGSYTSLTPLKWNESDYGGTEVLAREDFTAEPTGQVKLFSSYVHPQSGWTWREKPGKQLAIQKGVVTPFALGITVTPEEDVTCVARILWDN